VQEIEELKREGLSIKGDQQTNGMRSQNDPQVSGSA
jgi:hypothetical protein